MEDYRIDWILDSLVVFLFTISFLLLIPVPSIKEDFVMRPLTSKVRSRLILALSILMVALAGILLFLRREDLWMKFAMITFGLVCVIRWIKVERRCSQLHISDMYQEIAIWKKKAEKQEQIIKNSEEILKQKQREFLMRIAGKAKSLTTTLDETDKEINLLKTELSNKDNLLRAKDAEIQVWRSNSGTFAEHSIKQAITDLQGLDSPEKEEVKPKVKKAADREEEEIFNSPSVRKITKQWKLTSWGPARGKSETYKFQNENQQE
eukprot:TRINITY_DN6184_c0_g1_i1.p1 TRINITY_DN6184_c0_g1~~TRINITY_DN6184_c0_g1_i1.p1  ORF type:complete len:274 (-),score=67.79 TRINITY_DN6184_c0_g1_i1:4-795(-)